MDNLEYVLKKIRELIESRKNTITSGNISDMEGYKAVVGELTGLSLSVDIILDLRKNMESIDD